MAPSKTGKRSHPSKVSNQSDPEPGSSESSSKKSKSGKIVETDCGGSFKLTEPEPSRNKDGVFIFEDYPTFRPNLSPKEVLQAGSFGGTYFRPIKSSITHQSYKDVWKELPEDWLEGLNIKTQVASPDYDISINKYGAKCGGSLEMWETSGWINKIDPYGWFQWYCRFYRGRRSDDDARQVGRWERCTGPKGRWKNNLVTKIVKSSATFNDRRVSPVIRQVLLHWAYELTKADFDKRVKEAKLKP